MNYLASFEIDPKNRRMVYVPLGALLIGASWSLQGIRVDFMASHPRPVVVAPTPPEFRPLKNEYHAVWFHVGKIGQSLPDDCSWHIPLRIDGEHYLFYTYK